ncbi:hypothetical protein [Delftia sp. WSY_14]|uniref:hypothetical protein n=1 Tax=unclassified Delftia TaxID=2613839 RepID=UPI00370C6E3B
MHERPRLRVMLCSRGTVINVTRVDSVGRIRAVVWQRPSSLKDAPFSFVYEEDEGRLLLHSMECAETPCTCGANAMADRRYLRGLVQAMLMAARRFYREVIAPQR